MFNSVWIRCLKACFVVLALVLYFIRPSNGHYKRRLYIRSITDLKFIEKFDFEIAKRLMESPETWRLSSGSEIRRMVQLYLLDFYEGSGFKNSQDVFAKQEANTNTVSANPICAYRLIRRTAFPLQDLVSHKDFFTIFGELSSKINVFFLENDWPKVEDVEDAITAILRLQLVYNLNIEQLSNGGIHTVRTNCTLNSVHCYEISKTALKTNQFAAAIEWLELAKEKFLIDAKLDAALLGSALRDAIDKHNKAFKMSKGWEPVFFNREISHEPENSKSAKKRRDIQYNAYKGSKGRRFSEINFWGLCSGNHFQSELERSHLFCWYEFTIHPSFLIGPIKMEFLTRNPDLVQMYEVISEREIRDTISVSAPDMQPSHVLQVNTQNKADETKRTEEISLEHRTSVNGWMNESASTALGRKIERLTGLNVVKITAAEKLQVASYSFGGHYSPHVDSLLSPSAWGPNGDRIATFMFYFNDVKLGGSTAFTSAGVSAKPVKGSAVFWYDIYTDGNTDFETYHGACPVLLGEKWAANKWIRVKDQFLVRKCGLKQNQRFQGPDIPRSVVVGLSCIGILQYLPIPNISISENMGGKPKMKSVATVAPKTLSRYSYVSPLGLNALAELEWDVYHEIKYIYGQCINQTRSLREECDQFSYEVKKYLTEFEDTTLKIDGVLLKGLSPIKRTEKVSWNPLATYHTVARFRSFIQSWLNVTFATDNQLITNIKSYLNQVYKIIDGPTQEDLNSAMFAIINIHYMYGFSAKDIAGGYIDGVDTRVTLKASDCFLIGKHSIHLKYYTTGIEWLEHALYLVQNTSDTSKSYEDVYAELLLAAILHDKGHAKSEGYEPKFFNDPMFKVSRPELRVTRKSLQYQAYKTKTETNYVGINFWGICEGKLHQTAEETSNLFCWYEQKIHPSFLISPIKAEIHSVLPKIEVVQYHDIINDRIIESLKNLTAHKLVPASTVRGGDPTKRKVDPLQRQAIHGWAYEKDSEEAMKVSKLIERITGLNVVDTERDALQVAAYSPGSYYTVHTDVVSKDEGKKGFRMATFMFYLSDVEKGGGTAFVQAGVKVTPKKGSAVFWYNTFTSGKVNQFTWHGACPVVFGEKWVANKWIHYNKQQHLQCDTEPYTEPEILVNGESKYYLEDLNF